MSFWDFCDLNWEGVWVVDCELWVVNFEWSVNCKWWAVNYELLTVTDQPSSVSYEVLLRVKSCKLLVMSCTFLVMGCKL